MQPRKLLLISCVQILLLALNLQANPEETIRSLNVRLLQSTISALPVNPSFHIALRLSLEHSLQDEWKYLHKLKTDLQDKLSRPSSLPPSTGLVALYLLAFRASCLSLSTIQNALPYLKKELRAEKNHINNGHVPLTNYYQYSLGVLALCVNNVRIDHGVLSGLTPRGHHHHHHHHHIDTNAMMVLALKCVHDSKMPNNAWMYSNHRRTNVLKAMNKLVQQIQNQQAENGIIGNIYSTAVALQALLAVRDEARWLKGKRALIEAPEEAFDNPMVLSQLLPVLYRKTYLDIGQMECNDEHDGLNTTKLSVTTEPNVTQTGFVHLTVKDISKADICKAKVPLRQRMSLLDVLNEANFNFETKQTLWGPFLTSVCHLRAQDAEKTYWQLISGENTQLNKGIKDYHPHGKEHILLQLSHF
ncbi:transcobalamin-2-like [Mustelus asterias]